MNIKSPIVMWTGLGLAAGLIVYIVYKSNEKSVGRAIDDVVNAPRNAIGKIRNTWANITKPTTTDEQRELSSLLARYPAPPIVNEPASFNAVQNPNNEYIEADQMLSNIYAP